MPGWTLVCRGVEQIESGEFTLNYYQLSILAAALNTTNNQLLS